MAIVACSTPPGRSGIAVVRLSGKSALGIVKTFVGLALFSSNAFRSDNSNQQLNYSN